MLNISFNDMVYIFKIGKYWEGAVVNRDTSTISAFLIDWYEENFVSLKSLINHITDNDYKILPKGPHTYNDFSRYYKENKGTNLHIFPASILKSGLTLENLQQLYPESFI